jgi:hypothetical protein
MSTLDFGVETSAFVYNATVIFFLPEGLREDSRKHYVDHLQGT